MGGITRFVWFLWRLFRKNMGFDSWRLWWENAYRNQPRPPYLGRSDENVNLPVCLAYFDSKTLSLKIIQYKEKIQTKDRSIEKRKFYFQQPLPNRRRSGILIGKDQTRKSEDADETRSSHNQDTSNSAAPPLKS